MFFRRHKVLVMFGIIFIFLAIITLIVQQVKREKLKNELAKVALQNVRIGAGTSIGKLGTAIFGVIQNNGERTIKIAVMNVHFFREDGESSMLHKFFPVNNYSFSDASPLESGNSKAFGFQIDEIVPEDWNGTFTAKIVDLKFK